MNERMDGRVVRPAATSAEVGRRRRRRLLVVVRTTANDDDDGAVRHE